VFRICTKSGLSFLSLKPKSKYELYAVAVVLFHVLHKNYYTEVVRLQSSDRNEIDVFYGEQKFRIWFDFQ